MRRSRRTRDGSRVPLPSSFPSSYRGRSRRFELPVSIEIERVTIWNSSSQFGCEIGSGRELGEDEGRREG